MAKVFYENCPCKTCDRKGCGSYHDECSLYQDWKNNSKEVISVEIEYVRKWELFAKSRKVVSRKK